MIEKKLNILIVDDKPENLIALERSLYRSIKNINIITSSSGNEALQVLLKNQFALVILDVKMPIMDGYELAEIIRSRKELQSMPIIFLSAVSSDDFHEFEGYENGDVDFITKPVDMNILLEKVNNYLKNK